MMNVQGIPFKLNILLVKCELCVIYFNVEELATVCFVSFQEERTMDQASMFLFLSFSNI